MGEDQGAVPGGVSRQPLEQIRAMRCDGVRSRGWVAMFRHARWVIVVGLSAGLVLATGTTQVFAKRAGAGAEPLRHRLRGSGAAVIRMAAYTEE